MSNTRKIRKRSLLGRNIDQVSAADRRYFEQNQGVTRFTRRVQSGEFASGVIDPSAEVTVTDLGPGVRLRQVKL